MIVSSLRNLIRHQKTNSHPNSHLAKCSVNWGCELVFWWWIRCCGDDCVISAKSHSPPENQFAPQFAPHACCIKKQSVLAEAGLHCWLVLDVTMLLLNGCVKWCPFCLAVCFAYCNAQLHYYLGVLCIHQGPSLPHEANTSNGIAEFACFPTVGQACIQIFSKLRESEFWRTSTMWTHVVLAMTIPKGFVWNLFDGGLFSFSCDCLLLWILEKIAWSIKFS